MLPLSLLLTTTHASTAASALSLLLEHFVTDTGSSVLSVTGYASCTHVYDIERTSVFLKEATCQVNIVVEAVVDGPWCAVRKGKAASFAGGL